MNSIFHTSHCGSTLLSSLLSQVCKTYAEPAWTHNMIHTNTYDLDINNLDKTALVKYPSALCHIASVLPGKKVFLYRSLGEHLVKLNLNWERHYILYYYEYLKNYPHHLVKTLEPITDLEKTVFMWLNRFCWISSLEDVLSVSSQELFSNKINTLNKVCEFFDLPFVKDFSLSSIDVKQAGLNHSEVEVKERVSTISNRVPVGPTHGLIEPAVVNSCERAKLGREWVRQNFESFPEELL